MKINLQYLAIVGVLSLIGLAPAARAASLQVTAQIPFDFVVNNQKLSAGEYNLKSLSQSAILLQDEDRQQTVIVLAHSAESNSNPEGAKLVFNKYGDQYFLSQIWPGFSDSGQQLPESRLEREVMHGKAPQHISLLLGKSGTMEISKK